MNKYLIVLLIGVYALLNVNMVFAQEEKYSVDFIHKDKLYKTGSWWLAAGAGRGYFPKIGRDQSNFNVGLTGRYKKNYYSIGYHYSGDNSILYRSGERMHEIHLGFGDRTETLNNNLYLYAGPSYAFGYVSVPGSGYAKAFHTVGLYGELQFIQKIFYDIGAGFSIYGSANIEYQVIGIQMCIYFSTAFIDEI